MQPGERRGHDRQLIVQDTVDAAKASGVSVEKGWKSMRGTVDTVLKGDLKSEAW